MKQLSVSRQARGCLVMLSSLSSAENVAEREERGATALTALKLTSLSLVKEGTARVKRCRSHVCNEGVLCCNDSALSLSSIRRPAQSATEWFYNLMIQISYLKSLYRLIPPPLADGHWRPIIPIVHWSVIPGPWCQDSHHHQALCHAPPDGCRPSDDGAVDDSQLRMHGCCRGLGWASLIMFYRLTSQLGLSQPSLHLFSGLVIRHCPSSPLLLFRLGLNHRLRFPVKNQLNNLPIGIG